MKKLTYIISIIILSIICIAIGCKKFTDSDTPLSSNNNEPLKAMGRELATYDTYSYF